MATRKRKPRAATPEPGAEPGETRAHQLIPAAPAPARPRKVGVRRVVGHDTAERLLSRRAFRPAGNSRRFWARIEADDPFLPQPPGDRAADEAPTVAVSAGPAAREPYAAERASRTTRAPKPATPKPATPKPAPGPAAAAPAPRPPAQPRPQPQPQPRPTPKPQPRPQPQQQARPAPVDRRPPLIKNAHLASDEPPAPPPVPAGPTPTVRQRLVDASGRTADEVRREREAARAGQAPPPTRSFDDVMQLMSQLRASEDLYRQGLKEEATQLFDEVAPAPHPTPRPAAPAPRPAPPEPDPSLPVGGASPSGPVDRSPKRGSGQASLDDLFGGGEGRVRIGRRTVPRGSDPE